MKAKSFKTKVKNSNLFNGKIVAKNILVESTRIRYVDIPIARSLPCEVDSSWATFVRKKSGLALSQFHC